MDWPLSPRVANLLREFMGKEQWNEPPDVATGRFVQNNGVGFEGLFEGGEIAALADFGFANVNPELVITRHNKAFIDGVKYQTQNVRVTKYNNSIAYVNAQYHGEVVEFIDIHSIVTWQHNGERKGMFGNRFRTVGPAFETTYMRIVEPSQELVYVPLNNVVTPAVLVQSCGQTYISRLPNRWEND